MNVSLIDKISEPSHCFYEHPGHKRYKNKTAEKIKVVFKSDPENDDHEKNWKKRIIIVLPP
jgi:hypothetical protein